MFKKMMKTMVTVAAVSAVAVIPAMAAVVGDYNVEMYGKTTKNGNTGYLLSSHVGKMVKSVTEEDGFYVVEFQPITMGSIKGHISSMTTSNGFEGELDGEYLTLTYVPAGDVFNVIDSQGASLGTEEGTLINYNVAMSGMHSTSQGAIVVTPAN